MKLLPFLRDTLWVGYSLYFRPAALDKHLRGQLFNQELDSRSTQFLRNLSWLDQSAARSYLAQVALLCAMAALPFLFLAPLAPRSPSLLVLGLSVLLIWLIGFEIALWNAALGVGITAVLAILLSSLAEPGQWLTVVMRAKSLEPIRQNIVLALLIGLTMGLIVGWVAGQLSFLKSKGADRIFIAAFTTACIVAFVVTAGVIGFVAGFVAGLVAGVVGGFIACIFPGFVGADEAAAVVFAVTVGLTIIGMVVVLVRMVLRTENVAVVGAVVGVASGAAGGVAWVVGLILAFVMVSFVAGTVTGAKALDAVFIFGSGLLGVATLVVPVVVAVIVALAGADRTVGPSFLQSILLAVAGIFLGASLSARRWTLITALVSLGFMGLVGLVYLSAVPIRTALWIIVGAVGIGFFRLPLYALEVAVSLMAYSWRWLASSVAKSGEGSEHFLSLWRYDELILFPLPLLDRLLVEAVQTDRRSGLALVEEVAGTWHQGVMAQHALVQLAAAELAKCNDEHSIAVATRSLAWLPEIPSPTVQDALRRFYAISTMLDKKPSLNDNESRLAQLNSTSAALDEIILELTFMPRGERELFLPVAQQWRTVLRRTTTRVSNPYVAGDPLRGDQPSLFVGREDVLRDLLAHLRDRSQRPALVLFGQRRMGKSSLLNQLPYKFDEQTVPVRVDCQAAEMQESNAAFLFNLARAMQRQAEDFRQIELPPPPLLAEMTATAFSQWLEAVESQLNGRVLLLCLDEFERIGEAVNRGWLDERILDFLRNLIQHHPLVTVLLVGSHRPNEIGRPWSNYLIGATVLEISYLQPNEVEKLITEPIFGFPLHYRPAAIQHIIQLTRCQPLLVQLLCQQLVLLLNERGEREVGVAEVEAAVPSALSQGGSLYFTYVAEYDAGTEGQVMLLELARRGPAAVMAEDALTHGQPVRQEALRRLLARDLVELVDGDIRFQVELTRRWWESYSQSGILQ